MLKVIDAPEMRGLFPLRKPTTMKIPGYVLAAALAATAAAQAQDAPQQRMGQWGGGQRVAGTVTEVAADHISIKTEEGDTYKVLYSANTRFVKLPPRPAGEQRGMGSGERTPPEQIKATDIKVGDVVTAAGQLDESKKSIGAVFVAELDPQTVKQMKEMRANYGKTWLAGKVTAIDETKLTITGMLDKTPHAFVVDENTSFKKRRDPITLADVKVGDDVRVEGAVKGSTFVATTLNVMEMRGPGGPGGPGGPNAPGGPGSAAGPATGAVANPESK